MRPVLTEDNDVSLSFYSNLLQFVINDTPVSHMTHITVNIIITIIVQ